MLEMCRIKPLLESIDFFVQFAQQCGGFICDLVIEIKIYHVQHCYLYNDGGSSFFNDELWTFKGLLDCSHDNIHMKWVTNLNDSD
jgi:hypothetical protein